MRLSMEMKKVRLIKLSCTYGIFFLNIYFSVLEVRIICYQEISNAKTIPCQHVFCRRCIVRWMDEGNTGCPSCRTHINRLQNY